MHASAAEATSDHANFINGPTNFPRAARSPRNIPSCIIFEISVFDNFQSPENCFAKASRILQLVSLLVITEKETQFISTKHTW